METRSQSGRICPRRLAPYPFKTFRQLRWTEIDSLRELGKRSKQERPQAITSRQIITRRYGTFVIIVTDFRHRASAIASEHPVISYHRVFQRQFDDIFVGEQYGVTIGLKNMHERP